MAPAEAEADGEDDARRLAELRDRRREVALHAFGGRLGRVLPVVEVLTALVDPCCAAEVVERDRRVAALGEAQRELLVEAVQPADVRQDHDAYAGRLVRRRHERGEAVAVAALEHEVVVRHGGTAEHRDRRRRVQVEAHAAGV
jgi:hypothetical protein